ncbi:MAG: bifunctional glycosyltransferase family 2/GtrA family protein [Clostridia bacterium]|nr:bifunctional glycosyltransferase family 2/GtrA family protein [Clostridia bacterium]
MEKISIIIPAYKPDEKLIKTLQSLIAAGFSDLLIVDDGSGDSFAPIFAQVEAMEQVTLLRHTVNRGKGAALKTAMRFFLEHRPDFLGAVSADADGQHTAEDIAAVAKKMTESGHIVLGCRDFSLPDVPARSRFGNRFTSGTFRLFFGMKIADTQTGLRGYPRGVMEGLLSVEGERFEYETQMLFYISRQGLPLEQVKIRTVYIEENASSHFRPIVDSLRIYSLILKYLFSSVAASVIDALAFFLLKQFPLFAIPMIPLTFPAAFLARAISSFVNYLINAKAVFKGDTSKKTLLRYYLLAVVQIAVSAVCVFIIEHLLMIRAAWLSTLIKLAVDTVLFFISFRIQHKWVFNNEQ